MKDKEFVGSTVSGLVILAAAPIVVGAVVKSASKCYSQIADGIRKIKTTQNKKNLKVKA